MDSCEDGDGDDCCNKGTDDCDDDDKEADDKEADDKEADDDDEDAPRPAALPLVLEPPDIGRTGGLVVHEEVSHLVLGQHLVTSGNI